MEKRGNTINTLLHMCVSLINILIFNITFRKTLSLTYKELWLIFWELVFLYVLGIAIPNFSIYFIITSYIILWLILFKKEKHLLFPSLFASILYIIIGTSWIFSIDLSQFLIEQAILPNTPLVPITATTIELILFCFGIYGLKLIDKRLNLFATILTIRKKHSIISLLFLSTFLLFLYIRSTSYSTYSDAYWLITLLFFIFVICTILFLLYITKSRLNQIELLSLTKFYQLEKNEFELYQDFKHDYAGILLTLSIYLENNEISKANELIKEITLYSQPLLSPNIFLFINKFNIIPIRGLLMHKINLAQQKEIFLTINVLEEINDINMNIFDFSRCLTILLDNAIEAAEQSENPTIEIEVHQTDASFSFTITNTYSTKEGIILKKIQQKNYSTKAEHSGRGLYIVNKIIKGYSNCTILFENDNGIFSATLRIYNN